MENVIEVRYAGVVVGRSTKVRDWDTTGAFIGFAEPLPSGTSLVLRGDGVDQAARVVEVFESADTAVAGMQVKFVGAAEAARPAPKPAPGAAKSTPSPEPAQVFEPAIVTAAAATAAQAPVAVAEASPEASDAPSSAATAEQGDGEAGPVEHAEPGEQAGPAGPGGKRRRRRR